MLLDAAQGLVRRRIPATTPADAERAIELGVKRNVELGGRRFRMRGGYQESSTSTESCTAKARSRCALQGGARLVQAPHGCWRKEQRSGVSITGLRCGRLRMFQMARSVREAQRCSHLTQTHRHVGFPHRQTGRVGPMLQTALKQGSRWRHTPLGSRQSLHARRI